MKNKRLITSIVEIVVGLILMICSMLGLVDEFWSGMGTALFIVGIIFLIKTMKYMSNQEYHEKVDIELNDERNKYISLKAWAWSGYLFILISAVGAIGFKLAGKEDMMMMASACVSLIMVIYWISYTILKKKY